MRVLSQPIALAITLTTLLCATIGSIAQGQGVEQQQQQKQDRLAINIQEEGRAQVEPSKSRINGISNNNILRAQVLTEGGLLVDQELFHRHAFRQTLVRRHHNHPRHKSHPGKKHHHGKHRHRRKSGHRSGKHHHHHDHPKHSLKGNGEAIVCCRFTTSVYRLAYIISCTKVSLCFCFNLATLVHLVCDRFVIDRIKCLHKTEQCSGTMAEESNDRPGKFIGDVQIVEERFIQMDLPCSPDLPAPCIFDGRGSEANVVSSEYTDDSAQDNVEVETEEELRRSNNNKHVKRNSDSKHHKHLHPNHNHRRPKKAHGSYHHHHHQRHKKQYHRHKGHKKHPKKKKLKHVYKDRCVAVGDFCGDKVYGCDYPAENLYVCESVGQPLILKGKKSPKCMPEPDPCFCSSVGSICGSQLPPACSANPNAVYKCVALAARPELSKVCAPGLQCQAGILPNGDGCGSSNCNCKGSAKVCPDHFPASCGLKANAIYQCALDNVPVLVQTLTETEVCHTTTDGSIVTSTSCSCPQDGLVCGDQFPGACKVDSGSLYACKKGLNPVFSRACGGDSRCVHISDMSDDLCFSTCNCTSSGLVSCTVENFDDPPSFFGTKRALQTNPILAHTTLSLFCLFFILYTRLYSFTMQTGLRINSARQLWIPPVNPLQVLWT